MKIRLVYLNKNSIMVLGWISTSDYAVANGNRPSSPCSTDEERLMFIKNQQNKRNIIEKELQKIPKNEQHNLIILMKCLHSVYVEQIIEVKLVKKNKTDYISKMIKLEYEKYTTENDAIVYPEIWKDFNCIPFVLKNNCIICNKEYTYCEYNDNENMCDDCRENQKNIRRVSKWNCYIDINNNYYCKKYKDIPTEYLEWALNHSPYLNNPNESLSSKSNKDKIRRYIEHRINESNQ